MSKYIKFDRTKDSEYALSDSADKDTIYFTTDNQIITDKKSYGMATWTGTLEEYSDLRSQGLLSPHTLYIVI